MVVFESNLERWTLGLWDLGASAGQSVCCGAGGRAEECVLSALWVGSDMPLCLTASGSSTALLTSHSGIWSPT